jgi:ferritin heavy chain
VNKSLLNLHKVGEENNDPQLCDFIESEYLEEQVEAIKKIADLVTQLNRVGGDGLGCKLFSLNVVVFLRCLPLSMGSLSLSNIPPLHGITEI